MWRCSLRRVLVDPANQTFDAIVTKTIRPPLSVRSSGRRRFFRKATTWPLVPDSGSDLTVVLQSLYLLCFWSAVAAAVGGVLWNLLNRLNQVHAFMGQSAFVGGMGSEPHGLAVVIWALANTLPVVCTLVILGSTYGFLNVRREAVFAAAFLVGIVVASLIFYDFPLKGHRGFRECLRVTSLSFVSREFCLALIWSSILAVGGFGARLLFRLAFDRMSKQLPVTPLFVVPSGITIVLTTLSVLLFILVFPDEPRFETARGIVAGLVLRMSIFFGLFIGLKAK